MYELKLYKSKVKILKLIGMTIPFVAMGIWMLVREPDVLSKDIIAWICICFFGLAIPVGLFHFFDNRPQIIINEESIWDRRAKQNEIKWEQINYAYALSTFESSYIAIDTDDTYVFTKRSNKCTSFFNRFISEHDLKLNIGLLNVIDYQFVDLINELRLAKTEDRQNIIQSFYIDKTNFSISDLWLVLLYVILSITYFLIALTGITAVMTLLIFTGSAAVITQWQQGGTKNSKLYKYARIVSWFGFVNMIIMCLSLETYFSTSKNVALKLTAEIENYKEYYSVFPTNLDSIKKKIKLNVIEMIVINGISYNTTNETYQLQLKTNFSNRKKFNKKLSNWN